jgi:hypothetical protein
MREVAFVLAMMEGSCTIAESIEEIVAFARETDGVTLSGGRYRRTPENIYMAPTALANRDA